MANTALHYLYRDASNYKQGRIVVFGGDPTEDLISLVEGALDDGQFLIPSQVGLEDLQRSFPGGRVYEDDHVWHELVDLSPTDAQPTATESFADFAERFRTVAWDIEAAMVLNGLGEDDHPAEDEEGEGEGELSDESGGIPTAARRSSLRDALGGRDTAS